MRADDLCGYCVYPALGRLGAILRHAVFADHLQDEVEGDDLANHTTFPQLSLGTSRLSSSNQLRTTWIVLGPDSSLILTATNRWPSDVMS